MYSDNDSKEISDMKTELYKKIYGNFMEIPKLRPFANHAITPYRKEIKEGYVYIIRAVLGGPVKIGFSQYPCAEGRLGEIQNMCPYKLEVIDELEGVTNETETELHRKYKDSRLHGEWFDEEILPQLLKDFETRKKGVAA
jgi:hypothetical protein